MAAPQPTRQRGRPVLCRGSAAASVAAVFLLVAPCSPSPSAPSLARARCAGFGPMVLRPETLSLGPTGAEQDLQGVACVRIARAPPCQRDGEDRMSEQAAGAVAARSDTMRLRGGPDSEDETAWAAAQHDYTAVLGLLRARGGNGGEGTEEMRKGLGKHASSCSGFFCQTI